MDGRRMEREIEWFEDEMLEILKVRENERAEARDGMGNERE